MPSRPVDDVVLRILRHGRRSGCSLACRRGSRVDGDSDPEDDLRRTVLLAFATVLLFSPLRQGVAGTIVGSRHDLSAVWPRESLHQYVFNNYGEVCVYCHTPHGGNATAGAPLWNRDTPTSIYTLYTSPTMDTTPSQPSGVSLVCLSCHDGTIAPDTVLNAPGSGTNLSGPWYGQTEASAHWVMARQGHGTCGLCHYGTYAHDAQKSYLGTDLRNDHVISMSYPTPSEDPAFVTPPDPQKGFTDVKLFNGKVECPSCHNVHDPGYTPFLRKSNANSALCLTCHIK